MNKPIYFIPMIFAFILAFLIGCKKDLTGINALADYKVAAILDGVGDLSLITPNGTDRTIIEEGRVSQIEWSPVDAKLLYTIQSQITGTRRIYIYWIYKPTKGTFW